MAKKSCGNGWQGGEMGRRATEVNGGGWWCRGGAAVECCGGGMGRCAKEVKGGGMVVVPRCSFGGALRRRDGDGAAMELRWNGMAAGWRFGGGLRKRWFAEWRWKAVRRQFGVWLRRETGAV